MQALLEINLFYAPLNVIFAFKCIFLNLLTDDIKSVMIGARSDENGFEN